MQRVRAAMRWSGLGRRKKKRKLKQDGLDDHLERFMGALFATMHQLEGSASSESGTLRQIRGTIRVGEPLQKGPLTTTTTWKVYQMETLKPELTLYDSNQNLWETSKR